MAMQRTKVAHDERAPPVLRATKIARNGDFGDSGDENRTERHAKRPRGGIAGGSSVVLGHSGCRPCRASVALGAVVAASGWLLATLLPFAATPHVTYRQKPEKRLLVFHIIEQFGGASKSLMQFLNLAQRLERRPVLPGILAKHPYDNTVYRSANTKSVQDLEEFLELSSLSSGLMQPIGFREHLAEMGNLVDAILVTVMDPLHRGPAFNPLNTEGPIMECQWLLKKCTKKPLKCGESFMWRLDLRGFDSWQLRKNAKIWCIHNNVHLWKKELGPLLQKQFSWARHLLLLNWVGVTQAPCNSPNRICSSKLDTHGTMSALEHHLKRWRLSSNVQNLAEDFLVRHPELGWTYNAVQLRAEMVLNYRYLSPTCNDTGVYQWFQTLRSQISTWNGTWFRAKDLKKGGSRTLKRYDNESMQRLVELERDLWRDSPVTFIENECEGLPDVMCLLVDVALLSRAERLYLWGSSGGVDLWCRIERERLNLPSRHVFRSMLAPQGC